MNHYKGILFYLIGSLLIFAALGLCCYNLWSDYEASVSANSVVLQLKEHSDREVENISIEPFQDSSNTELAPILYPDYILYPEMEMPVEIVEGNEYIGILEIPTQTLSLPVMSQWSYDGLKLSPCRYSGSAYSHDLIIVAHNYSSHFGHLKDLSCDDIILFYDADGNMFQYKVIGFETLAASDVEGMKAGDWDLTLFTCSAGGTNRLAIRCILV